MKQSDGLRKLQLGDGYLAQTGWLRSLGRRNAVDKDGQPIPWFTYPSIAFLQRRLRHEMHVFEWGLGSSTLWWAKTVSKVVSVEHDRRWIEYISKHLKNMPIEIHHIVLKYGGEYSHKIRDYSGLHIIAIDGRDRINCAKHASASLGHDGVIIWDNTERPAYLPGIQHLNELGFRQLDFVGMGPMVANIWQTSVFYRDGNCLGL